MIQIKVKGDRRMSSHYKERERERVKKKKEGTSPTFLFYFDKKEWQILWNINKAK